MRPAARCEYDARVSRTALLSLILVACSSPPRAPIASPPPPPPPPDAAPVPDAMPAPDAAPPTPIADAYRDAAARIIAATRADRGAYTKLAELTDHVGHRLSGSPELDLAIAWAKKTMTADGHDVRTEPVMVPHWVRGAESAAIVAPIARPMIALGLGGTVATPQGGITARVVVVTSWAELAAKKDQIKGAIVLYDVPMPPYDEATGTHYGDVVPYRWAGPSKAAELGAVAVLMRSVTAHSLRTPHTGAMGYDPAQPKIPAMAVTVEDALLLHRLADQGEVKVKLVTSGKLLPDAPSANVIGELRGRELPDEVVVIGAHLDSWDVGQGAHDDGAGVVSVMQALTTLRTLGLTPRRTIRVVLFVNEENGGRGGKGYAAAHAAELAKHVAALEMDLGAFPPRGFHVTPAKTATDEVKAKIAARMTDLASLLAPIGATQATLDGPDADVTASNDQGVLAIGLDVRADKYFDYHHTEADTFDKIDPAILADDVAAIAVFAYVAADLPTRIDASE